MIKKKLLLLLKIPPPFIGPTLASEIILNSRLKDRFELIHLDTSDHRDIDTLGKLDFQNLIIAIKHYVLLIIYIIKYNPEAVYLPNAQTTVGYLRDIPFVIITKFLRKKLIGHLRGGNFKNWYKSSGKIMQKLVKIIHPMFDAQIVLGTNLVSMYKDIFLKEKIFVIPNGKDFDFYPYYNKMNRKEILVLFLSNFDKSKGIMDVLQAVPILHETKKHIEFHFAGGWTKDLMTRKEIEDFIENNKDLPIYLHGKVEGSKKMELLLNSDIFVFPTYYHNEGHPWVLIEAMAAGLPIITTDHAAIPETVFHGKNGYLIPKKNPQKIAETITFLIDNPEFRKSMGIESRRIYEEKFTEGIMIDKLTECFNKVLMD